jgi:hypothetical protein
MPHETRTVVPLPAAIGPTLTAIEPALAAISSIPSLVTPPAGPRAWLRYGVDHVSDRVRRQLGWGWQIVVGRAHETRAAFACAG